MGAAGEWRDTGSTAAPRSAFSLIELLCVIGIIGILLSLLLPVVFGAFSKAKKTLFGVQEPSFIDRIQEGYTPYRLANPSHPVLDRDTFIRELHLDERVARWLRSGNVTYFPFSGASNAEFVVLQHRVRPGGPNPEVRTDTVISLLLVAEPN